MVDSGSTDLGSNPRGTTSTYRPDVPWVRHERGPTRHRPPPVHRRPPRPSASIMITRDGQKGLEVLLCRRVDELPAFPGFWAFPGGGRSRVDAEAVDRLPQLAEHGPDLGAALASMMRELVEEIGLNAEGHRLHAVDPSHRARVLADRRGWLELVLEGSLRCDPSGIRLLGRRTTPPFGPMRFENTFLSPSPRTRLSVRTHARSTDGVR